MLSVGCETAGLELVLDGTRSPLTIVLPADEYYSSHSSILTIAVANNAALFTNHDFRGNLPLRRLPECDRAVPAIA
jgi:hypothetical protein